jgi:hypothetical protein
MSNIKLQANDGKYVMAKIDNGQKGLWAIGNQESEATPLEVLNVGGGNTGQSLRVQFKSGSEYVTLHGETVVLDGGNAAAEFRSFEVLWLNKNEIALKGANGKYVSREKDGVQKLTANRTAIGPWERFTVL